MDHFATTNATTKRGLATARKRPQMPPPPPLSTQRAHTSLAPQCEQKGAVLLLCGGDLVVVALLFVHSLVRREVTRKRLVRQKVSWCCDSAKESAVLCRVVLCVCTSLVCSKKRPKVYCCCVCCGSVVQTLCMLRKSTVLSFTVLTCGSMTWDFFQIEPGFPKSLLLLRFCDSILF